MSKSLVASVALLLSALATDAVAAPPTSLNIANEKYTLPNGLVVILAEDHTLPRVTTNLMVRVGSRFEKTKRSGFAHLFEHLMFMGTERVPTGMFDQWMEAEGGYNNAWTSSDRTNYFNVAPSHASALLLYLDADRLSALGSSMSQDKLEAQRKVVRNERRQTSEDRPYGKVELRLPELLYPEGHPYHHPVIGSHEDLESAQVKDVKDFFADYYVPNNMSLVVAGDFDPKETKAQIEKYYGGLARRDVPAAPAPIPVTLKSVVRETLDDKVELAKIVMAFHSPARFAKGDADLDILSSVLADGKASRLYKALVYDRELAQSVDVMQESQDLSSIFTIEVIVRPKVNLDEVERAIDAELKALRKNPPTQAEVTRARNDYETSFVKRLESIDMRASILNTYETYLGDPSFIAKDLERYRAVTPASIAAIATETLTLDKRVILRVVPRSSTKTTDSNAPKAAPKATPKGAPPSGTPPKSTSPAPKPAPTSNSPEKKR